MPNSGMHLSALRSLSREASEWRDVEDPRIYHEIVGEAEKGITVLRC